MLVFGGQSPLDVVDKLVVCGFVEEQICLDLVSVICKQGGVDVGDILVCSFGALGYSAECAT